MFSLYGKYLFWAFKTGWISLIFTGYNSDYVIFIVEDYKFIMETSLSLDTEYFWHLATSRLFMFIMDYMLDYVISWTCEVSHDILLSLQSISCKTVSRIFFLLMTSSSWWTLVSCVNIFSKCQFFALFSLLQLITMVSRMHSELQRCCQDKRFPAVQGFTES